MIKSYYHGWALYIGQNQAVATQGNKGMVIRQTGSFRRSAQLIKSAVDRRNKGVNNV